MIQQSANQNATNSELDAKRIIKHSDEEVLELIASLRQQREVN